MEVLLDDVDLDASGSLTLIKKLKKMIRCRLIRILLPLYQRSPESFETNLKHKLWKARIKSDEEFQQVLRTFTERLFGKHGS